MGIRKPKLFVSRLSKPVHLRSEYSGDLNSEHSNYELLLVRYSNGLLFRWWLIKWLFGIQMVVWIRNHLTNKLFSTIRIPTSSLFRSPLYPKKFRFGMVLTFEYWTIVCSWFKWIPSPCNQCLDPHCTLKSQSKSRFYILKFDG